MFSFYGLNVISALFFQIVDFKYIALTLASSSERSSRSVGGHGIRTAVPCTRRRRQCDNFFHTFQTDILQRRRTRRTIIIIIITRVVTCGWWHGRRFTRGYDCTIARFVGCIDLYLLQD